MATDYRIISGGTTFYLKPSRQARTAFTGSGTPWTTQSTTPFDIQMNNVSGPLFNPRPSIGARTVGVGPNVPTVVSVDITYEAVEWPLTIGISATTRENALDAKQALMRALDNGAIGLPAQFYVKPDGVTAAVYWEILGARSEDADISWNQEHAYGFLRTVITLLVREHGGADAGAGDTVLSAQTFNNTVTTNTRSMGSTGTGDLANEGQPLNISIVPSATQARFHLASVYERVAQTSGFSGTTVTTSFTTVGTGSMNLSSLMTRPTLACRLIADVDISSTGSTDYVSGIQMLLQLNSGGTYFTAEHPGIVVTVGSRRLVDFGDVPIPVFPFNGHDTSNITLGVTLQLKKSGSSDTVTATVGYIEVLLYWEYCVISGVSVASTETLIVSSYPVQTGRTSLPYRVPHAARVSGNQVRTKAAIEGQVPKYRRGASLWLASGTTDDPPPSKVFSHTYTVSAQQCPLWRSARAD